MINAVFEPYKAAGWLASRHDTLLDLLDRLAAWTEDSPRLPDVESVAVAVNEYDADSLAWKEYSDRRPAPFDDALYDAWEAEGPKSSILAKVIAPMSSGEKRYLRMLAVLAPATRVRFNLGDTDGVDAEYRTDWRRLIAGDDWGCPASPDGYEGCKPADDEGPRPRPADPWKGVNP